MVVRAMLQKGFGCCSKRIFCLSLLVSVTPSPEPVDVSFLTIELLNYSTAVWSKTFPFKDVTLV